MILVNFKHRIQAPEGVHARPAGYLADLARKYLDMCTIKIGKVDIGDTQEIGSKSGDVTLYGNNESTFRPEVNGSKISVKEQFSYTSGEYNSLSKYGNSNESTFQSEVNGPKVSVKEQVSCTSGECNSLSNVVNSSGAGHFHNLGSLCDASQTFSVMKMGLKKGDEVMFCIRGKDHNTEKKVESELNSLLAKHF